MKEKLEKRIEELQKAKDNFFANVNACEGAIIELKVLLEELNKGITKEIK